MSALAKLLAAAEERRKLAAASTPSIQSIQQQTQIKPQTQIQTGEIIYNAEQQEFIDLATTGNSCILIGAAGTGKTTCQKGAVTSLIQSGRIPFLSGSHKYLKMGTPGIVICAYTRRAVANIRKAVPEDMKSNCITIHKLLEYEPEYYEVTDPNTGESKTTMKFMPTRNSVRPLDESIKVVIIEESSMVAVELFEEIRQALPHHVQYIFLGDIQQLPPVFGSAILGYKMQELPTVELKQVYRQALESPIIRLAHRILSGKPIPVSEYEEWKNPNQLTIHPWKKKISADNATLTLAKFFKNAIDEGAYDPEEDMILIPFNKSCGTDELNKHIANHIARRNNAVTFEVIAGFNRHYFSVGDKVLYEREDAEIIDITNNKLYVGAKPKSPSAQMDYWGFDSASHPSHHISEESDEDIDAILERMASSVDKEDRVTQASHEITLRLKESGQEIKLDSASAINALIMGYALTVHKSQGSEWRKVFVCIHHSHATMIQRELLYTAVTRAREELYVICEPDTFTKGILNQRIKGNTLAEKAEFFKGAIAKKQQSIV